MTSDRHTAYFNLLEALKDQPQCPLCFLEFKAVRSYLESVLYESVNDPVVRSSLRRSKGYCSEHARMLASFGDGLGVAMLYDDVLSDFVTVLNSMLAALLPRGRRGLREWTDHSACPACAVQQEARARYGACLAAAANDPDLRSALETSSGVCVPHLLFLLAHARDPAAREYLTRLHEKKYRALSNELKEFCRKHDYCRRSEGFGKESDAWRRVIRVMGGSPSPF